MELSAGKNNRGFLHTILRDVRLNFVSVHAFLSTGMLILSSSWNAYFRSYLQVVNGLSVTTADYTLNTYSLSAAFVAPIIGV